MPIGASRQWGMRGVKRPEALTVLPQRRSSRVTTERLKVEIEEAKASGNVALMEQKVLEKLQMEEQRQQGSYEALLNAENESRERILEEHVEMRSICYNNFAQLAAYDGQSESEKHEYSAEKDKLDAKVKDLFTFSKIKDSPAAKKKGIIVSKANKATQQSRDAYSKLICTDVAKLVEHRITSTFIHPSEGKLIIAAGDKSGNVGIWNATNGFNSEELLDNERDIYYYTPHVSNVTNLFCSLKSPDKLYSASYDGTIRYLNLERMSFSLGFSVLEEYEHQGIYCTDVAFLESSTDATTGMCGCAYIAKSNGEVSAIDMRASRDQYSWSLNAHKGAVSLTHEYFLASHFL